MGRLSQVSEDVVLEEDEDVVEYGEVDGEEEGDDAEVEDEDESTDQGEEDNMSLLELMHATVTSNFVVRAVKKPTNKIISAAKSVSKSGLKLGWILFSTAVIIGVPMMLASDNERMLVESQNRMSRSAPSGPIN